MLDDISQNLGGTEKTSPITKLAMIVNKLWLSKLTTDKPKEKVDKYRPAYCERLIVPRVNQEIWTKLDHATKGRDI